MNRMEFNRKTLIENIERVLAKARQEELPATIKEVHAFGGILRDKERVHDFDAVFLFDQTPEQAQMWDRFRRNFNNVSDENREISRKTLHELLQPYHGQNIPLNEAVLTDSVSKKLEQYGIKPKWAACFSWTDFYFSFLGIFYPDLDKVLRKLLLKGVRGIQAIFIKHEDFKNGHTMLVAKNFQLAWTPELPDVRKNLEMSQGAKIAYLVSELVLFQDQLVPLKEQLLKLQAELSSMVSGTEVRFNFQKMNSNHADFPLDKNETCSGLLTKCELARQELRAYREEVAVLQNLKSNIERLQEWKSDKINPLPSNYVVSDLATLWTLSGTPKYEVKEERIREMLKGLGLPEDHIVTIQRYGTKTDYRLEPDTDKRKELLVIAEEERNKNKYLRPLNRIAKRFDKDFYVNVELMRGKPTLMTINYSTWPQDQNEDFRKTISSKLRNALFDVKLDEWSIRASKIVRIDGIADVKQLSNIIENALEKFGR